MMSFGGLVTDLLLTSYGGQDLFLSLKRRLIMKSFGGQETDLLLTSFRGQNPDLKMKSFQIHCFVQSLCSLTK